MPKGAEIIPPPRILLLSASVGVGHLRAAEAVELALRETVPDVSVRNLDVMELTNRAFGRLYSRGYLGLMNRAPYVHGYFYDLFDRPVRAPVTRSDRVRLALQWINLRHFIQILKAEPWDLIINTHFLPAEVVASLRRQGKINTPQVTVTTDFDAHRMWVQSPCEHYFTATEEGSRSPAILGSRARRRFGDGRTHPSSLQPAQGQGGLRGQARSGDGSAGCHADGRRLRRGGAD